MASFKGYAISTLGGAADHTYVQVDDKLYGCWGRKKGGKVICSGSGDGKHAQCMANWECIDGTAGIIYGETGVCHQTANRILRPARITVHNAKGYAASHLIYGRYGTSHFLWKIKKHHCLHERLFGLDEVHESADKHLLATQLANNEISIRDAMNQHTLIELKDVIKDIGGEMLNVAKEKLDKVVELQNELRTETRLHIEGIGLMSNGEEFANRQNALINEALTKVADMLSPEEYHTIFHLDRGEEIIVVDPQIMTFFFDMFVKK